MKYSYKKKTLSITVGYFGKVDKLHTYKNIVELNIGDKIVQD